MNEKINIEIIKILLYDQTSKKNIIWATNDYLINDKNYTKKSEISLNLFQKKDFIDIIQPSFIKDKILKKNRIKEKAEVFTPSWVCNKQNNLIDEKWFGKKNVFNREIGKKWKTNKEKIILEESVWQKYVLSKRLEITCGEAPYIVSRYDVVEGSLMDIYELHH
ncbi:hypothetical protein [Mesomycoplasma neurolyticum]|uniref:Uncharacterized protein n=1 Tax=Mesomycoplasma neurolyticum TaxID=2120 RepID=A0A449A5M6_9BACT|nr:hypothetical protein [Mesomycoplasma neurolyticum]VEU59527.1 Uncharacterised protein [Mesomycoplasma neurolyticum]